MFQFMWYSGHKQIKCTLNEVTLKIRKGTSGCPNLTRDKVIGSNKKSYFVEMKSPVEEGLFDRNISELLTLACNMRKGTFEQLCKLSSWISLRSLRRLIRDGTLRLH